ncbi:MAG: NAD/NADP octopine/nopaline dehydrogenase family protein [Rhodospirillales bacterium]|nr:NAD/NADP octopine/nopaline dehydrogenase family protein [Rhodospirillales bacterium]MCB9995924.1 NAD/NADP octopine/nopaline dehydrogenase family protein [Rhodospirillales bacterium]
MTASAKGGFDRARQKTVTIIGAGNTGCALAADLKRRGYQVCLYAHPDHADKLDTIAEKGALSYDGVEKGHCHLDVLTKDIGEALRFSENTILALPSYAHEQMFALMTPHVQGHTIVNLNGNFSSFVLEDMLKGRNALILETNSAPHASKADLNGHVDVWGVKNFIPIAALPPNVSEEKKAEIEDLMPCKLEWHDDIIAVSLQSYNGVLHPAALLLNTGWAEAEGIDFRFYREGMSNSVCKIIDKIDEERLEIARRYGHGHLRTTLQALKEIYGGECTTLATFLRETAVYQDIKAPSGIDNRYIKEDIPFILVPWYALGQAVGFEAKTMKSVIDLASVMHGVDYMEVGRTLKKMNLPERRIAQEQNIRISLL